MPSTYSNLGIELIASGDQAGTWGTTTNTNLGTLIDQAISGYTTTACTGGTDTITIPNGATGVARNMFLELTGTGGGSLVVPTNKKLYFIYNNTAGAITVKVTTGVSVPAGAKTVLVCNGTDIVVAVNYLASLTLGAALPVASGGTSLTTLTANNVLLGNGTSAPQFVAPTTSGNILTANGTTWVSSTPATNGTVTSVAVSGGSTGLTTSGGPITSTGTITLAGTLAVANGGTAATSASAARTSLGLAIGTDVPSPTGSGASGTWGISVTGNAANVSGTVAVANGGTGATSTTAYAVYTGNSAGTGFTPIAPSTSGNLLTSNGTNWASTAPAAPPTSVTSVAATVPSVFSIAGSPITTSGTLAMTYSGTALPVSSGGSGATTLTANNVILGNGTSAVQVVAPGTSGNLLTSNGTTWVSSANTLTTAQVTAAYAGLTAGDVGTMAFAKQVGGGSTAFGATLAGTSLRTSNASGESGSALSGTWRCLGDATYDSKAPARATTLWIRTV